MRFCKSLTCMVAPLFCMALMAFTARPVAADLTQVSLPQPAPVTPGTPAPEVNVLFLVVDFAGILQVEGDLAAIAVGNPKILDSSMANHHTVILTGLMAGTTNLIALDDAGAILADVVVHVGSQKPGTVTVRRGTQLRAYSCTAGLCEGAGDDQAGSQPMAAENGG